MLFTPSSSVYPADQLIRVGNIDDGEVLRTSNHEDIGRPFVVTVVRTVFRPKDGFWYCNYATVSGPLLKKDGTPGKVFAERSLTVDSPHTPDWVRKIVRHLQPTVPAPSMQMLSLTLD